jgi:hypothetical protein
VTSPLVRFRLPDGSTAEVTAHAVVGRSPIAAVRIDDARVSTVHAEISWRDDGPVMLARGGRLLVNGRAVREILLTPGLEIMLVPGRVLQVVTVLGGPVDPIPPTAGREALRFVVEPASVSAGRSHEDEPAVVLTGTQARVMTELLRSPGGCPWDRAAETVWPGDGAVRSRTRQSPGRADDWTEADERRLRNRWDQQIHQLRKLLDPIRPGMVEMRGGVAVVNLGPDDCVLDAHGALRAILNPIDQAPPSGSDG